MPGVLFDMAKRFIDTSIFRKPLVRAMKAPYKALFIYLLCECDHAGIWDVELDVAGTRLGIKIDEEKAVQELCGAVVVLAPGKWLVKDFVSFQYGELNPANRVHASVLSRLSQFGVDLEKEAPYKPLASPLKGAKDKDRDKDNSEKKEHASNVPPPAVEPVVIALPFTSEDFTTSWAEWETSRRKRGKPISEAARKMQLAKCLEWGEERAIAALKHSITNDYQGLFEPNNRANHGPASKTIDATNAQIERVSRMLAATRQ